MNVAGKAVRENSREARHADQSWCLPENHSHAFAENIRSAVQIEIDPCCSFSAVEYGIAANKTVQAIGYLFEPVDVGDQDAGRGPILDQCIRVYDLPHHGAFLVACRQHDTGTAGCVSAIPNFATLNTLHLCNVPDIAGTFCGSIEIWARTPSQHSNLDALGRSLRGATERHRFLAALFRCGESGPLVTLGCTGAAQNFPRRA